MSLSLSKVTTGDERGTASLSEVTQEESEGSHEFIRGNTSGEERREFIRCQTRGKTSGFNRKDLSVKQQDKKR